MKRPLIAILLCAHAAILMAQSSMATLSGTVPDASSSAVPEAQISIVNLQTGLDPGARRDLWQYLRILRDQEQVTVLVTTHLMEEAERCDRLAILNEGKLVGIGTPAELKREIGGDVIVLESENLDSLATRIRERFDVDVRVVGNQIRIEKENAHRFVTDIVETFPAEIDAVSIAKPSLEDVFIRRTGHRFWSEPENKD